MLLQGSCQLLHVQAGIWQFRLAWQNKWAFQTMLTIFLWSNAWFSCMLQGSCQLLHVQAAIWQVRTFVAKRVLLRICTFVTKRVSLQIRTFLVCLVQAFTQTCRISLRLCADIWTKNRRPAALDNAKNCSGACAYASYLCYFIFLQ